MPDKFTEALAIPMSAKRLVLSIFGALDDSQLPIAHLIVGASVFDLDEAAVRVAVNRMSKDGVLSAVDRGIYQIGESGAALYEASRAWRRQHDRLQEWRGGWICVHTAHLGRTDRKALRSRQRAFSLGGFKELEDGLWLRPDNIALTLHEIGRELSDLGLERSAVLFHASDLVHISPRPVQTLWDREAIERSYRAALHAMEESRTTLAAKPLPLAAQETLQLGLAVVTSLNHDPLLPDTFVDSGLRSSVYQSMIDYHATGKTIWTQLFEQAEPIKETVRK